MRLVDTASPAKTKYLVEKRWNNCVCWTCAFIVSIIGWAIIIYSTAQLYFYLNPAPAHFTVFTIFQKGEPDPSNDQLRRAD